MAHTYMGAGRGVGGGALKGVMVNVVCPIRGEQAPCRS
jgi:hypothetical protein